MKHYFDEHGKELPERPRIFKGRSPVSDDLFRELGGTITDDGTLDPKERVKNEFADLISDLAQKTDKVTPEEFLQAAQNGISADLITLARAKEVPDAVIDYGRARIVEIMADALRFGLTWADILPANPSASVAAD